MTWRWIRVKEDSGERAERERRLKNGSEHENTLR